MRPISRHRLAHVKLDTASFLALLRSERGLFSFERFFLDVGLLAEQEMMRVGLAIQD